MSEQTCALWYWRRHAVMYDTSDTEAEAAHFAVYLEEDGEGVPIGVQFADGRTVRVADWPAYREAEAKVRAAEDEARRSPKPPTPVRQIKDPFEGRTLMVDADEPAWLGVYVTERETP